MKKKQFLQFRRAMATLLAVAMIGQGTIVTTAENFVVDTQAVAAGAQTQETEVQAEEAAEPAVQTEAEVPAEPAVQAEVPAEPADQTEAEVSAESAVQAESEIPAASQVQDAESSVEPEAPVESEETEVPKAPVEPTSGIRSEEAVTDQEPAVNEKSTLQTESEIALMSILPEETAVAAYEFWDAEEQTIIDTQYITENDKLIEPETPAKDGAKFIGWYVGDTQVVFGENITGVQNGTIIVKPRFEEVHYIFFHNPAGEVVATKEGVEGDVISITDVTFGLEADQSITGWYTSNDYAAETKVKDSLTLQKENIDLFAKVESGFWITYDSDGGKYFAPEFYVAGQTVALTNAPAKRGYTFTGWFDEAGNEVKSTDKTVKVKAGWEANKTADYTVIYWQQKVTDSQAYAYVESGKGTGNTGDTVDANTSEVKKAYSGFEVNNSKSTKAQIAADGSTIINVYYDRILCTVNYYVDGEIRKTVTGLYGTDLKEGDWWTDYYWYSSTNKNNRKGCILLTSYDFETAGYANNAGNTSKNGVVNVCNFYGEKNDAKGNIYYYNEQADGSFKLVNTIKMSENGTLTIHEKYAGYDLYKYATGKINQDNMTTAGFWEKQKPCQDGNQTNSKPVYIANTLKTYQLCYSNGGVVEHKENIKYTVSLKSCESKYTPARPESVDPNYTFTGWYSDRECTTLFDFNATMPATNVIIYAGWKAPEVTVTAHENETDPGKVIPGIKYNDTVDENQLPEIKTDDTKGVFLGWFTKNEDGSYTPWNFETKIRKNTDLYARVISKGAFTVSYDANGGTGTVEDTRKYAQGAKADIRNARGLTAPSDGAVFLYWNTDKEGKGTTYYPNDKIVIEGNITLFAIWGCSEKTSLIYDGNGGTCLDGNTSQPQKTIADIRNNEKITLGDEGFTRTGYKLVGWSKDKNNLGNYYHLGESIIVNKNDPENVLYAVWEKEEYTLTIKYVYGEDGSEASKDYSAKVKFEEEYRVSSPEIPGYTADKTVVKGTMPAENLTVTVTYTKRGDYKYTVHYYWNGTTEKVLEDKLVKDQSYNEAITEMPEKINGYTPVSEAAQTVILDTDNKEITFYYYKNVELTANSDRVIYDGESHTVSGYTGVPADVEFKEEITVGAAGTDAGDYQAEFSEDTVGKTDIKEQYIISGAVNGNLHIDLREITIEAGSATKKYDGTPLVNGEYKIVKGLLAADQTELISVEGSQTLVGFCANVITVANIFAKIDGEKVDVTKNYAITLVDGKLEVTDGTDEDPVEPGKVVTKNHDESKSYMLGDTITFTISVTNIYDTAKNITITELPGVVLEGAAEGTPNVLVKTAVPAGETITIKATYIVTETDAANGSFVNRVKAEFEGGKSFENTDIVPIEDPADSSITVTKRLTNIQGELLAIHAVDFYVTLFADETMTQKAADTKLIHFDENQGTSSVAFEQLKRGTYYVAETDAEGKVVAEGTYNNGSYVAQYPAGNKVEIAKNGTAAQLQFDNQFRILPDEYYPAEPTEAPKEPTEAPTEVPKEPTATPTEVPKEPTAAPTEVPKEPTAEPTETVKEPTEAPQITQQPEEKAVNANGVKTEDSSPLTQLAFILFAAAAVIVLVVFLRKKDKKDMMK